MPVVRDYDNQMYIRQWSGGILFGCFELNGRPCFSEGVPDSFEFQLLSEDWEHCGEFVVTSLLLRAYGGWWFAQHSLLVNYYGHAAPPPAVLNLHPCSSK